MSTFLECLSLGQAIEDEFITKLAKYNITQINKSVGKNKEYDFEGVWNNTLYYFEVKYDKMSSKTGNIAIEFSCNKKESGITATKADYWLIKMFESTYVINTNKLKGMIQDKKYFKVVSGGDRFATQMYLFKGDYFITQCKEIV